MTFLKVLCVMDDSPLALKALQYARQAMRRRHQEQSRRMTWLLKWVVLATILGPCRAHRAEAPGGPVLIAP